MSTGAPPTPAAGAATPSSVTAVVPYLTVADGAAALAFYTEALGGVEVFRVADPEGRIGHAEFRIGAARFFLSDEYPEMGVTAPSTLGGASATMYLELADVDAAYTRALAAGADGVMEPADQPHGTRHGVLVDPFGHRWMVAQTLTPMGPADYEAIMTGSGFDIVRGPGADAADAEVAAAGAQGSGGIWAALNFADAMAGIRFVVDVLGFEERLVVPHPEEAGVVEHSQLVWPEGGVVQAATAGRAGNPFSERPTGTESLYVVTADPMAVYDRCVAAGATVVVEPEAPEYDPEGLVFSIRDPEGNLWSFGTYRGEGESAASRRP